MRFYYTPKTAHLVAEVIPSSAWKEKKVTTVRGRGDGKNEGSGAGDQFRNKINQYMALGGTWDRIGTGAWRRHPTLTLEKYVCVVWEG